jgi:hypothetical protein
MKPAALHALADAAGTLARRAREGASEEPGVLPDALIPVAEAAGRAATSVCVVRDAIRRGDLAADGAVWVETLCDGMLCVPVVVVRPFARRGSVARGVVMTANPGGSQ